MAGSSEKSTPRRFLGFITVLAGLALLGWVLSSITGIYDRLAVIQDAWDTLAACVICFRLLHDDTHTE